MNVVSTNTIALRQECRSGKKTESSGALLLQQMDFLDTLRAHSIYENKMLGSCFCWLWINSSWDTWFKYDLM